VSEERAHALTTPERIHEALRAVRDPRLGRPIADLGLVREVRVDGGDVYVRAAVAVPESDDELRARITDAVSPLGSPRIELEEVGAEERAEIIRTLRGGGRDETTFFVEGPTEVVAVASGKGGVGKSSVTVNLAAALAAEGERVGILDADVWGFSVPRMMGIAGRPAGWGDVILPPTAHGVKVISMGFFVSDETPVIWRGPMLHKAIQQFLGDVWWGELDVLLVDLPPGTGDVSISLASFIPRGSMLVVTTPQDAARKVAERAGRMAQHPNINLAVMGVIENMAGFVCPHCGEVTDVFGEGGGKRTAAALDAPFLGAIPMQTSLRVSGDEGTPVVIGEPDSPAGQAFREVSAEVARILASPRGKPLKLKQG